MSRLITFIVVVAVAFLQARLVPLAVRRNWIHIAAFGRLDKPYGYNQVYTAYFSPYKRLMNALAVVLVALVDWLCFSMLIALFVSLFDNQ